MLFENIAIILSTIFEKQRKKQEKQIVNKKHVFKIMNIIYGRLWW